jgi:PleD family two-component response regulator
VKQRRPAPPETILLVDKNRRTAERHQRDLKRAGYRVFCASGQAEAEALLKESPGVVVCSASLPGGAGYDFVRRVKAARKGAIACVLMVRKDDEETARRVAQAGGDNYLVTPLKNTELRAAVRGAARVRALRRHLLAAARARAVPAGDGLIVPETGFYTFEHFRQILFLEVKRAIRYQLPLAVALIAYDPLDAPPAVKPEALQRMLRGGLGVAIRKSIRDTDIPVHYKGDNVLLVMPHTDRAGALVVSRRIHEKVHRSALKAGARALRPTLSIGVGAAQDLRKESFAEVIKLASRNLSDAQRSGGGRVIPDA